MGPERAAMAVEAVRSGRMTFRAAAKTSDISVGPLQKRVSGCVCTAGRVGPDMYCRFLVKTSDCGASLNVRRSSLRGGVTEGI